MPREKGRSAGLIAPAIGTTPVAFVSLKSWHSHTRGEAASLSVGSPGPTEPAGLRILGAIKVPGGRARRPNLRPFGRHHSLSAVGASLGRIRISVSFQFPPVPVIVAS